MHSPRVAPAWHIALGIPHGLVADPQGESISGAVRRGGELVSLDREDYELWLLLLTPLTLPDIESASARQSWRTPLETLDRLRELGMLVATSLSDESGSDLGHLRPIPLGVGLGNTSSNPATYRLQDAALSLPAPLSLDALAVMLWWEFDGATSMASAIETVASRMTELPLTAIRRGAAQLTLHLMTHRFLFLDTPPATRGDSPSTSSST